MAGIVTNNSNFLTTKGHLFRQRILKGYDIATFYDLRECNSILFKKRQLEEIELGADEPPAVLIFKKKGDSINKTLRYITPSLDNLSKLLKIIVIKNSEIKIIPLYLFDDDLIWRVLSVGDVDDYNLIAKLKEQKGNGNLKGSYGFQVTSRGKKSWKNVDYVDKDCIEHFMLTDIKKIRPEGVSIRRVGSGRYSEKKLLIKRYVGSDLRIKAAYDDTGYRFKENLLALFFDSTYDYRILLALYNSSLISYFLFLNSAQVGKGTFDMLHANEIESAPIPAEKHITPEVKSTLTKIVNSVYQGRYASKDVLHKLDEAIFDVYHLKDFEKQRIRDFLGVRERKHERSCLVKSGDFEKYFRRFSDVFGFVLKEGSFLNASAFSSSMIGAGITFLIVDKTLKNDKIIVNSNCDIGNIVRHIKKRQLAQSEKADLLKQEKIKLYDRNSLTIVKSNEYKDWTETEAIKDANEEIQLFLESLPEG